MVMKLYPGFALVKLSQDGTSQVRKLSPEFFSADSLRRASDVVLTADGLKLRYICFPQLRESLIEDALFEN